MRPYNPYYPYANYTYNPCMQAAYGYEAMHEAGPQPTCPPGATLYTVQEGDTLYSIARLYGSSVSDIMAANPSITDMNMIYTGQMLCIPGAAPVPPTKPAPCPTGTMAYTVAQGDTLSSIADRFSVSVYALTVANPGFSADNLMPGMVLCIAPVACTPPCVESQRYTIGAGEDLTSVAQKFSVSPDALLMANPFAPPCYFAPGNMICLTSAAVIPPVTPKPTPNVPSTPNMPGSIGGATGGMPSPNMPGSIGGATGGIPSMPKTPNMPGSIGGATGGMPGTPMPNRPNAPNAQRTRR